MISLAPLRYGRILSSHGGPVDRLEYGTVEIAGKTLYQASAWLSRHLNLNKPDLDLVCDADGCGTHHSAMVARHMAISEAIERWAFHYLSQSGHLDLHGFRTDPTTSGMAAYPGLLTSTARKHALREAVERYCQIHWWNGQLPHRELKLEGDSTRAIEISNYLTSDSVILTWRTNGNNWTAYGLGTARDKKAAIWKAMIEMERSNMAMKLLYRNNPGFNYEDLSDLSNHLERRLVYYALPEGLAEFQKRIKQQPFPEKPEKPVPTIDGEIKGPWSKYATVWRVVYPSQFPRAFNPRVITFLW